MADHFDGFKVARERIDREARDETGRLDLGRLGLSELPVELLSLRHLRALNLGSSSLDGPWTVNHRNPANRLDAQQLGLLARLENLLELFVDGMGLSDLGPLSGLSGLRLLSCHMNPISDLRPLSGFAALQSLELGIHASQRPHRIVHLNHPPDAQLRADECQRSWPISLPIGTSIAQLCANAS